ncbi:Outer membrane protein 26 precursor [compost metagenome]
MKQMMIAMSLLLVGSFATAESKIVFVDMEKAIQATTAGKKAKTDLEGDYAKKKKELAKKEADLKKMHDEIEKKKAVLSEQALQQKQAELQQEMMKFREVVEKSQAEIRDKMRELQNPIMAKMKTVIEKIQKEKGYTGILELNPGVLAIAADSDITEEVIAAFEKK